jgi:hypothetical protein
MESMVTDPKISKVLMILDAGYKEKADKREGGVGSESRIISQELYKQVKQEKFIPIIMERDRDGQPFLPVYVQSRIYIDLSSTTNFASEYETLIRNIHDRPALARPAADVHQRGESSSIRT